MVNSTISYDNFRRNCTKWTQNVKRNKQNVCQSKQQKRHKNYCNFKRLYNNLVPLSAEHGIVGSIVNKTYPVLASSRHAIKMEHTEITIDNPTKLRYIRTMIFFLRIIGAWPGEFLGEKVSIFVRFYRKYLPVQQVVSLYGQLYYLILYVHELSLFDLGQIYIIAFMTGITGVRVFLCNFKSYGLVYQYFFTKFHLSFFRHKGEYYQHMYDHMNRISLHVTIHITIMKLFSIIFFNATAFYNNLLTNAFDPSLFGNVTYEFSVNLKFQFFDPHNSYIGFLFVSLFNCFTASVCAFSVCTVDLFMFLMVFQVIGHIQALKNDLKEIPQPKSMRTYMGTTFGMYDDAENKEIKKTLVEIHKHHKLIISFTEQVSSFFGPILGVSYLFQLLSCCLLLLEISTGDFKSIVRYGPITVTTFGQLFMISIIFELVGHLSEQLKESIYYIPWESMSVSNQRTVCILLHRMQYPINVTSMGMFSVGVDSMSKILKTTFSYFAFLQTLK